MEDLSTNVWQTVISTLITEGEPAVKTATDFIFVHKYPLLKKTNSTDQPQKPRVAFFHRFKRRELKFTRDKTWLMFTFFLSFFFLVSKLDIQEK